MVSGDKVKYTDSDNNTYDGIIKEITETSIKILCKDNTVKVIKINDKKS